MEKCSSCKVSIGNLKGTVEFLCPKCQKATIIRCKQCRAIAAAYTCPKCGFTGPN